uniref:KIB1-4 beta-propeller domain-containing protein n=1 Tax=Aegilops tauschii TaxID=37682 RepID=M8CRG2_AEGTA
MGFKLGHKMAYYCPRSSWRLALPRDGVEPVATAVSGKWSLVHSRNGVKDAIHYNGRFYSITYFGEVEAWEECGADDPGVFASVVIAPRLLLPADTEHRKYLMAAPGGPLMVVLKEGRRTSPSFKVQVLGAGGKEWKVTDDIGETALFVGGNGSFCVSTTEHPELRAGCAYYTEDDPGPYKDARDRYYNGINWGIQPQGWQPGEGRGPCAGRHQCGSCPPSHCDGYCD